MRIWIKSPLSIYVGRLAESNINAANGVVIDDNQIESLVPAGSIPEGEFDEVFDASEFVVIPSLISTHHHYYQTLTHAVPDALNKELFPWLKSLYPIWSGLTDEMVYVSSQLACAELLLSDCTTSSDHHYRCMARPRDFFNDEELHRLGNAQVSISHCPTSNMMLGSGQCRSLEL